jgi:hypothetical protein
MMRIFLILIILQFCSGQNPDPKLTTNIRTQVENVEDIIKGPYLDTNLRIQLKDAKDTDRKLPISMFPPNCDPNNQRGDDHPLVVNGCIDTALCINNGICPLVYFPICGCDGK